VYHKTELKKREKKKKLTSTVTEQN